MHRLVMMSCNLLYTSLGDVGTGLIWSDGNSPGTAKALMDLILTRWTQAATVMDEKLLASLDPGTTDTRCNDGA